MKIYSSFLKKDVDVTVTERDGAKIILHNEIEKLADENDVNCTYETVDFKGLVAVVKCIATATTEEGKLKRIEAFGESNDKNLETAIAMKYPYIMAAKRAYDRAVLRCLGLYGFYSDCEIDIDKKASGSKKNNTSEAKSNNTGLSPEFQLPSQKKGKNATKDDKRPLSIDDLPQDMLEVIGDAPMIGENISAEVGETVRPINEETSVETVKEETNVQPAEASENNVEAKADDCVTETKDSEIVTENTSSEELEGATIVEEYDPEVFANYTDEDFAEEFQNSDGFDALDLSDDDDEYDMSDLANSEVAEDNPSEPVTSDDVTGTAEGSVSKDEAHSETVSTDVVEDYAETALVEEAEFVANPTSVEEKVYEENPDPEDPFEDTSFLNVVLTCGKFVGKNMTTFDAYKDTKMRASLVWVASNTLPNKAAEAQKKAAIDTIAYLEKHPELLSA